ncbi:hypothetical protein AAG570_009122 [Ranatra chinensis]|uniref:Uncharacterized protein n=1 Tax=Ranatra chinensis TaxID=642074 RepID=A0ABD0YSZ8_9HEMI
MASKRRNMFHKNKTQETTENELGRRGAHPQSQGRPCREYGDQIREPTGIVRTGFRSVCRRSRDDRTPPGAGGTRRKLPRGTGNMTEGITPLVLISPKFFLPAPLAQFHLGPSDFWAGGLSTTPFLLRPRNSHVLEQV